MMYTLESTEYFRRWWNKLQDKQSRIRILRRLDAISIGSFGDHKQLAPNLFELRFFFGSGYRIYYTIRANTVVLLLAGGDKAHQQHDIDKATELLQNIGDGT